MFSIRHLRALVLVAVASTGCITVGNLQRANTTGKGNVQVTVSPVAVGISAPKVAGDPSAPSSFVVPSIEGAVRVGVTDTIDVGARLSTVSGVEFMGKFQLTPPGTGVVVSLAPGIGGVGLAAPGSAAFGIFNVELPILIGIPVGPHQFILGPKIQELVLFAGAGSGSGGVGVTFVGGSIGMAFKAGEGFQVLPEFSIQYPAIGAAAAGGSAAAGGLGQAGVFFYQLGVGFLIGGK